MEKTKTISFIMKLFLIVYSLKRWKLKLFKLNVSTNNNSLSR